MSGGAVAVAVADSKDGKGSVPDGSAPAANANTNTNTAWASEVNARKDELQLLLKDLLQAKIDKKAQGSGSGSSSDKFKPLSYQYESAQALLRAKDTEKNLANAINKTIDNLKTMAEEARKNSSKNEKRQKKLLKAFKDGLIQETADGYKGVDFMELLPMRTKQEEVDKIVAAFQADIKDLVKPKAATASSSSSASGASPPDPAHAPAAAPAAAP
jgi:hypothetical protein